MPCDRSGMCCRVIFLVGERFRPERIRDRADDRLEAGYADDDGYFVSRNWHPISDAEALAVNPAALLHVARIRKTGDEVHLYRCEQLDEETNLCRAHEVKPHVCSIYPRSLAGKLPPTADRLIWPGCGYVRDILEENVERTRDDARRAMLDYLGAECGEVKLKAAA